MHIERKILLAGLIAPAFMAATAYAAEPGFYIGLSGGQSTLETSISRSRLSANPIPGSSSFSEFKIDGDETGYKGYLGYQFTPWFALEGGYVELGSAERNLNIGSTSIDGEMSVNGWEGFAVFSMPLGPVDVFAKIGSFTGNIDADGKIRRLNGSTEHFSGDTDNGDALMAYGAGIAYNFGHGHWSLRAEYEGYDADHVDELYFVSAGLTYRFFEDKSAPAPAPVAVAAAPAHCADSDADGVCNTDDQCPNTPPGKRVGPAGCDCDYTLQTHFAFDSAELTAEDKAELDKLATVLKNPKLHFVGGEIEGYTDDVGEAAYNSKLSKRRADAVASYLQSHGVSMGANFATKGFGEEDPIADNSTENGRAQNRRVTIRRTDCGPAN